MGVSFKQASEMVQKNLRLSDLDKNFIYAYNRRIERAAKRYEKEGKQDLADMLRNTKMTNGDYMILTGVGVKKKGKDIPSKENIERAELIQMVMMNARSDYLAETTTNSYGVEIPKYIKELYIPAMKKLEEQSNKNSQAYLDSVVDKIGLTVRRKAADERFRERAFNIDTSSVDKIKRRITNSLYHASSNINVEADVNGELKALPGPMQTVKSLQYKMNYLSAIDKSLGEYKYKGSSTTVRKLQELRNIISMYTGDEIALAISIEPDLGNLDDIYVSSLNTYLESMGKVKGNGFISITQNLDRLLVGWRHYLSMNPPNKKV